MIKLGVNIDHIATIRQARRTTEPDPVAAAALAEQAGADGITVHLREDRRHIQERDVALLRQTISTRMNFELAMNDDVLAIAHRIKPNIVCIVPEKREEITTEGGLDVAGQLEKVKAVTAAFLDASIEVSLFIDPDVRQIEASAATGAPFVELHTGAYGHAYPHEREQQQALAVLAQAADMAFDAGLRVNAGHGLTYRNVQEVAAIRHVEELNIGHSIVSRAVYSGLPEAVREMKRLMIEARLRPDL